jgi:hypothetical protein
MVGRPCAGVKPSVRGPQRRAAIAAGHICKLLKLNYFSKSETELSEKARRTVPATTPTFLRQIVE